jgi:diketogulonate reductase-like aldo/keto reductase
MENIEGSLDKSLLDLKLDYLDLLLIHWPVSVKKIGEKFEFINIPLYKKWKVMEEMVAKGKVRSIGLSNYNLQIIMDLLCYCKIRPVCNQIELHPFNS